MSLLPAIRQLFTMQPAPVPLHEERAFVTGPATVDQSQQYFGISNETFQPAEYASYVATSNGVYACVNVRSKTLASLPLKVYQESQTGDRKEITSGPLWLLLRKVNPYWTLSRLLEMTEQALCVWGECFWFMERKGGKPAEIWWARADRVKVHPHPTEYISHFTFTGPTGREIRYERDETVWMRYANVVDQYSGLSPLAAARLSADTASASMHSNFNIFRNGTQLAGVLTPKNGVPLSEEQAEQLTNDMQRRFKGVENAHRFGILRFDVDFKALSMTPHDAEFLGLYNLTLEDIARAYSVPIDKIGGKRTYQNVEESEKVFWHDCMLPEARFIAAEITEQLLPHFGDNLLAEFDASDIAVLSESEDAKWTRIMQQIQTGYDSINNLRKEDGLDPVPWGDVWWAQSTLIPIDSNEKPEPVMPPGLGGPVDEDAPPDEDEGTERSRSYRRTIAYGSDEHRRLWDAMIERTEPHERKIAAKTKELMSDQQQSVLAKLRGERAKRDIADFVDDPFDKPRWTKAFRQGIRPVLTEIVGDVGSAALTDLAVSTAFDVQDPNVLRAVERQAQKFAVEVNATTWDMLRQSLSEGIAAGESADALAGRVTDVMADRIRSSSSAIARTETTRASTTGTHESWRQSGVVSHVQWLAALDERTRATHVEAHGQTVELGEDFTVGGCTGPGPGELDCAREVVNCRCTTVAVLDVEAQL